MKYAVLLLAVVHAWAAEPIAGKWLMKSQEVAGRQTASRPLTLRITQSGDLLEFEFSVSENLKKEITLRFAARLDGSDADMKDSAGRKIGTVKLKRGSPSQYFVTLEGPNRPAVSGKMTLSNNGKTLTSESDAVAPNGARAHTVQIFDRQ